MKRLYMLMGALLLVAALYAQNPGWAAKAAKSVFTLKTFAVDGSLIASSNGFYVGTNGEAVSSFAPFRKAHRAVVIDAAGKELAVDGLIGVNDMYDVAKFRVAAPKSEPLAISSAPLAEQATVWLLPYAAKKAPACVQGSVSKAETFQGTYTYYTLSMPSQEQHASCPVLNGAGEVVGLMQPATDGQQQTQAYAVSVAFANSLQLDGFSMNDPALRSTFMTKLLPADYDKALLMLYMAASASPAEEYASMVEQFIRLFPNRPDGYVYRARLATAQQHFAEADRDMQQAVRVADKKDDAHYQYSLLIYQKELYQSDQPFDGWSLDRSMEEAKEAYRLNPMPVYRQQQAQVLYAQQKYDEAFAVYDELRNTPLRSAELFFAASQCKLMMGDHEGQIAQLDSAVSTFSKPYLKAAAPYLLAYAQALSEGGKYRPAVTQYNEYARLMSTSLTAQFYYLREQAELGGHLFQQALDDIRQAISLAPTEPVYYAEKASIEIRVGMTDEAILSAQECVRIAPDASDGYLFLGLAQCLKGNKQEGLQNLTKAKELGDSQAQTLIDKYAQ